MMTKLLVAAGAALLVCTTAIAHHSFAAEFDEKKPVTLEGTVTQMEWVNPHCWIHLEVKNPDGSVTNWAVEGNTPNILPRKGFTKDTLKQGTEIVVQGFQAKRGGPIANGSSLTLRDGRKLFLGSSHDEAQDKK
jgi:hypothetical protein